MSLARRAFLRALPGAAVAAPIAAKAVLQQEAGALARVSLGGFASGCEAACAPTVGPDANPTQIRMALLNRLVRQEVESIIYEDNRYVNVIEPDLAVMRSFSLNAKVVYQRQRNVARRIEQMQAENWWPWQRINTALGLKR